MDMYSEQSQESAPRESAPCKPSLNLSGVRVLDPSSGKAKPPPLPMTAAHVSQSSVPHAARQPPTATAAPAPGLPNLPPITSMAPMSIETLSTLEKMISQAGGLTQDVVQRLRTTVEGQQSLSSLRGPSSQAAIQAPPPLTMTQGVPGKPGAFVSRSAMAGFPSSQARSRRVPSSDDEVVYLGETSTGQTSTQPVQVPHPVWDSAPAPSPAPVRAAGAMAPATHQPLAPPANSEGLLDNLLRLAADNEPMSSPQRRQTRKSDSS